MDVHSKKVEIKLRHTHRYVLSTALKHVFRPYARPAPLDAEPTIEFKITVQVRVGKTKPWQ